MMINRSVKLILLLFTLCSLTFSVKAQDDNIIDKVIWVVGDEAILKSDVEEYRIAMQMQRQRMEGDPYCFIPEQLAVRKLYLDQARIDSINIPTAELNKYVSREEKRILENFGGSRERMEESLGMTLMQYREHIFENVRVETLVGEVQNSLTKNLTLTPSEVRKYYSQIPKDSLPYIETSVEVQILTNEPKVPLKELDIVKGRLRDFTERINSGEADFATLAIAYSEDPGSALNGGEMPFYGRAELDPAFANVAFSLGDPKQVSNIVETEFGFHIIQLIERRGDRARFRHILLRPKVPQEEIEKSKKILSNIRDTIMNNVASFEEAVLYTSYDKDTRRSEGLMVNTKLGYDGRPVSTSRFLMEELPQEIGKVVANMEVGEISEPFVYKQERTGKDIVAIVKLKSRKDGHVANVSDDYEDLRVMVEAKKRDEILKKWLQRKIRDTYVYIDEDWKNCDFQYEGWIKDN